MRHDFIDLDKEEIPVQFELEFPNGVWIVGVNYNETYDFYTIDLYDESGSAIKLGEKLVINQPLWQTVVPELAPCEQIVPMDESGKATTVNGKNFYETVFLVIDNISPDDNEDEIEGGELEID